MGSVVALGEAARVAGFALGGARVLPADDPDDVLRAWEALPPDAAVVILTPRAAEALGDLERGSVLTVVMPT